MKKDGLDKEGRFKAMESLWKHMIKRAKQLGYDKDMDLKSIYGEAIDSECERYEKRCRNGGYEGDELKEIMEKYRKRLEREHREEHDAKCKSAIAKAM